MAPPGGERSIRSDGMVALDAIVRWPVAHGAAAVVGPGGALDCAGNVNREFRLASVTKLLTATAVLVAVEEETVHLDDAAGPPGATIRHLLAHASGLSFDGGVVAPAGARRIYSNSGFDALADHVGRAADMPFAAYLQEAVLSPLAMDSSVLRGSAAHAAWSTVADLTRFAAELFAPSLISSRTLATAMTVTFPGLDGTLPGVGPQRPLDWGLGFEIRAQKEPHWTGAMNSPTTVGHFGASGTFLWFDPSAQLACICLTDHDFSAATLPRWRSLSDAVLHEWSTRSALP